MFSAMPTLDSSDLDIKPRLRRRFLAVVALWVVAAVAAVWLIMTAVVVWPLLTADVSLELPSATPQGRADKPTYISMKPDLKLAIGENAVKRTNLVAALDELADKSKNKRLVLRADRAVPYNDVKGVMEILRSGGYAVVLEVAPTSAAAAPPADAAKP